MEKSNRIQRSEEWKQIHEIVKQLLIKNESGCDAMDAPSAATEIEELFLKLLVLQNATKRLYWYSFWYGWIVSALLGIIATFVLKAQ